MSSLNQKQSVATPIPVDTWIEGTVEEALRRSQTEDDCAIARWLMNEWVMGNG